MQPECVGKYCYIQTPFQNLVSCLCWQYHSRPEREGCSEKSSFGQILNQHHMYPLQRRQSQDHCDKVSEGKNQSKMAKQGRILNIMHLVSKSIHSFQSRHRDLKDQTSIETAAQTCQFSKIRFKPWIIISPLKTRKRYVNKWQFIST